MASLPLSAGVGMSHEAPLEVWFKHGDNRMVNDAVTERSCADEPGLGHLDHKRRVRARLPTVRCQLVSQSKTLRFQVEEDRRAGPRLP